MNFTEIFKEFYCWFLILSVGIMIFYYSSGYNNKPIKMNDIKTYQSILPLWFFTIFLITYFMYTSLGDNFSNPKDRHKYFPALLSFVMLGLSGWTMYSIH